MLPVWDPRDADVEDTVETRIRVGMGIALQVTMPTRSASQPKSVKFVRFLSVEPYTRIKSLTALVRHFGDLGRAGSDTSRFTRSTLPRIVPCANPLCCDGGYDIGPLLDDLLTRDAREAHAMLPCRGTDGSPLARDSGKAMPCTNSVEIEITLDYQPASEHAAPTASERASPNAPSTPGLDMTAAA